MKRIIMLFCLMGIFAKPTLHAQEDKDFHFTIKTNPLSALGGPLFIAFVPITGEYKILFEARTARKQSIETGFGYLGPSVLINLDELSSTDSISGIKTNGYRFQVMYKFFLTKNEAPQGFYVGPHVSYAKARLKNKDDYDDYFEASKLNANVIFGYQLITGGGFTLNVYTGLGLKVREYEVPVESEDVFDFDPITGTVPNVAFGFSFGYAF